MLLEARGLFKHYKQRTAVQDISLTLEAGEVLGIIGESGCGKSTLARLLTGFIAPDAGTIHYQQNNPQMMTRQERAQFIQMMFQDSGAALHPRLRIKDALSEVLRNVRGFSKADAAAEIQRWLPKLDLSAELLDRFPHQLSGGQRQRACLLRALLLEPKVLVCDEPVTALDRMTQARVLSLFETLRKELGFALIFISHDLSTVRSIADRVAVMYAGQWMETGATREVLKHPQHPYTRLLLQSLPKLYRDPSLRTVPPFSDALPKASSGCPLASRCPFAEPVCEQPLPKPSQKAFSACIRQGPAVTGQ